MKNILRTLVFLFASFGLTTIRAAELSLDQYRDQIVYVDFWASWCIPCKKSFPWMNKMHQKYKDQGLKIIAINVDENPTDADKFLAENPAEFEVMRDPEGGLAKKYKLVGMPTSLLFDTQGKLVSRHTGFKQGDVEGYETDLKKLLPNTATDQNE